MINPSSPENNEPQVAQSNGDSDPQEDQAYVPDLIDEIAGDLTGNSRTLGYALIDDM